MQQHGTDSLDLRRILHGRRDREMFHWFLEHIASVVVGVKRFEQVKTTQRPSEWLLPSLEAFCLVCVENYFVMVQNQVDRQHDTISKSLWTCDARGKKKNQGWSMDGIRRYNHLVHAVRMDRKTLQLEDELFLNQKKEELQQMEMERLNKMQEVVAVKERGWEPAENDFSDHEG